MTLKTLSLDRRTYI